jgi:transporter family-2 protein
VTAWPFVALAILAGVALPLQAAINAVLARSTGNPLWASAISFSVGLIALLLVCSVIRAPWPALAGVAALPWWAWTGGALGALYVASSIIVIPKLGAATLVALVVAGQMLASLFLDHFGALGLPQQGINAWRILGATLLIGGVVLIRRF